MLSKSNSIKTIPLLRTVFLFFVGASGYFCIELLFRGYSHWTMMLCGGISLVSMNSINTLMHSKPLYVRAAACALAITFWELMFGIFDNLIMRWHVWDYSKMPLNFMGQICLSFSLCWYLLSVPICAILSKISFRSPLN